MLVLTRRTGQKIIIANDIEVTVLEIRGDSVKVGIEAPKHITIYREEIFEEITKSNLQATEQAQTSRLREAVQLANLLKPKQPAPEE